MNIYRGSNAPILLTFDEVVSGWPLWDICILDGNGCIELKLDENSISFPEPNKVLILLKQSETWRLKPLIGANLQVRAKDADGLVRTMKKISLWVQNRGSHTILGEDNTFEDEASAQEVEVIDGEAVLIKKGFSPYIGENGNWFEYSVEERIFIDTGIYAGSEGFRYEELRTVMRENKYAIVDKNDNVLTKNEIVDLYNDPKVFVYLIYENVVQLPAFTENSAIAFSGTYIYDGRTHITRVVINDENDVHTNDVEVENIDNKTYRITSSNKDSEDEYPSNRAITHYVDNAISNLATKESVYTKTETDTLISNAKEDLETEMDDQLEDVNQALRTLESEVGTKVSDVKINGTALPKTDGGVEIPIATEGKNGLVRWNADGNYGIRDRYRSTGNPLLKGELEINPSGNGFINARTTSCPITPTNLDYAVKAAMCDGKGASWSDAEKASARERMGIDKWEEIFDATISEESVGEFNYSFPTNKRPKKIRVIMRFAGTRVAGNYNPMSVRAEKYNSSEYVVLSAYFGSNLSTFDSIVSVKRNEFDLTIYGWYDANMSSTAYNSFSKNIPQINGLILNTDDYEIAELTIRFQTGTFPVGTTFKCVGVY